MFKYCLISTLLCLSLVILPTTVSAQDATSSGVTYEQLSRDYFHELEQYRQAERRFELDKAEFTKLQTLASREKAVESMRPYLEARARVLYTYMVALEFLLRQAQGIDVVAKEQTLSLVVQAKEYMIVYADQVENYTDRESINAGSQEFETVGRALANEAQFRTLTLLAIGRVNRVYDQLNLATIEFKDKYVANIPNDSVKARIERGLRDVDYQNEQARSILLNTIQSYPPVLTQAEKDRLGNRLPDYSSNYSQSVSQLQRVHSAMRTSIRFLKELERQI